MSPTFDAIVIGGGVAGLSAAKELLAQGRRVCLLEAAASLGGRIRTVRSSGWPTPLELGAEFVHARPDFFARALQSARVVTGAQTGTHVMAERGRLEHAEALWQAALARVEEMPDVDESYAAAVRKPGSRRRPDARVLELADAYVQGFNAADSDRISARALSLQSRADLLYDGGRIERVLGGYDRLVDDLARPLAAHDEALLLRTRAVTIDWHGREVRVHCRQGLGEARATYRGRAVVITVPLSLLKQDQPGHLRFSPSLPRPTRAAIATIAMGSVTKLILRFRLRFWQDARALGLSALSAHKLAGLSFLHTPAGPVPTWWVPRPLDVPVLVGWAAGPAAASFAQAHQGDKMRAVRAGVSGLARALGCAAAPLLAIVEDAELVDWSVMPFCHGAYSWLPVGALAAPDVLARPIRGRLFFAGEATHTHHQLGTVHGAMETGLRAAHEVARVLGRPIEAAQPLLFPRDLRPMQ